MERKKLLIANWKNNPDSLLKAQKLAESLAILLTKPQKSTVVICPPTVFLGLVVSVCKKTKVLFGVQNISLVRTSSHTGGTTLPMVKTVGASYVLLGHSERRKEGETDELVNKKIKQVVSAGLIAVLCVGESERDEHGEYLKKIESQIILGLAGVSRKEASRIAIAYEPLWAIGARAARAATEIEIEEMLLYIKKVLVSILGADATEKIILLYGGSVDIKNAHDLLTISHLGGLLIGRSSLNASHFAKIVAIENGV